MQKKSDSAQRFEEEEESSSFHRLQNEDAGYVPQDRDLNLNCQQEMLRIAEQKLEESKVAQKELRNYLQSLQKLKFQNNGVKYNNYQISPRKRLHAVAKQDKAEAEKVSPNRQFFQRNKVQISQKLSQIIDRQIKNTEKAAEPIKSRHQPGVSPAELAGLHQKQSKAPLLLQTCTVF